MNSIKRSVNCGALFVYSGGTGRGSFAPPDPLKGRFPRSDFAVRGEIKEEMIFLRKIRNGGTEDGSLRGFGAFPQKRKGDGKISDCAAGGDTV